VSDGTENPVCPECSTEDPNWWEGAPEFLQTGSSWEDGCSTCGARYRITMDRDNRFHCVQVELTS